MSLTELQTQICIGSLLGDMSASRPKNGKNFHLSCYHSQKQLDWLQIKWDWLQPFSRPIQYCTYVDKRDGKARSGGRFHTVSLPCFTDIANLFYTSTGKIIPYNIVELLYHPISLAVLICDDGSWDKAGIQIASKQFGEADNKRLAEALNNNFAISAYVTNGSKYFSIRIPAQAVKRTFDLCKEFIPKSMYYKFGGDDYHTSLIGKVVKSCPSCGKEFITYLSDHKTYCSRDCAARLRTSGYATRHTTKICFLCNQSFVVYRSDQIVCENCRTKPYPGEKCAICGGAVKKHGRKYCSSRCSVIGCHKSQGHKQHIQI